MASCWSLFITRDPISMTALLFFHQKEYFYIETFPRLQKIHTPNLVDLYQDVWLPIEDRKETFLIIYKDLVVLH